MFCYHHHFLLSSFLNLFITSGYVHTYATRFETITDLTFVEQIYIKQLHVTIQYLGPKIWNPFHYPSQAPPLLLIVMSVYMTFSLFRSQAQIFETD